MCPVTFGVSAATMAAIQLGVAAASAAASVAVAVQQTNAQNQRAADNAQAAKDAYVLKTVQQNARIRQEGTAAQQKKEDARLKTERSKGTAVAAAAAGGVQGASVQTLLADFERSEGVFRDRVNQQLEADTTAIRFDTQAFQAEADQRIQSVQPAGLGNIFGAAVGSIGGIASAGDNFFDATVDSGAPS